VARRLARELPEVIAVYLDAKGRGRALRAAWSASDARVLAYMDVDLSTDLAALLPLVAPLISGHSDLAIGPRLTRGSRVVRGIRREVISRGYNLLLRGTLAACFSDASLSAEHGPGNVILAIGGFEGEEIASARVEALKISQASRPHDPAVASS
jgi:Glycosyl transferase family 2